MGIFDDAVPGGNVAKPLMIALGALLVGKMMSGGGSAQPASSAPAPADTGRGRRPRRIVGETHLRRSRRRRELLARLRPEYADPA